VVVAMFPIGPLDDKIISRQRGGLFLCRLSARSNLVGKLLLSFADDFGPLHTRAREGLSGLPAGDGPCYACL
jgi:hypothetical protein